MRYRLEILAAADADVDAAAQYIAEDNADAAMRFLDAVGATYRELGRYPKRWLIYQLSDWRLAEIRKRSVIGFRNYLVFYRVRKRTVEIIRVLHGARDLPSILWESE